MAGYTRYTKHTRMYEDACKNRPTLPDEIEGWSGDGDEIIFRMEDGGILVFDGYHGRFYRRVRGESKPKDHDADREAMSINLPDRMKTFGIDDKRISALTGISVNDIMMYTSGRRRPGYENVMKICDVLGCSPADLTVLDDYI